MDYEIAYDVSKFLDASIEKVLHTLLEAFILVSLVVYMFLGDLRSTLIPTLAVPVSLIGTFFFLRLMGLSINLITLFAWCWRSASWWTTRSWWSRRCTPRWPRSTCRPTGRPWRSCTRSAARSSPSRW